MKQSNKIFLKQFINDECIFRCPPNYFLKGIPEGKMYSWQFYLRRAIFNQSCANQIADWLLSKHTKDVQYAAMETAGPPMLSALMARASARGIPIEGFAVRKEKKKYGLFNQVEGQFDRTKKVIILDDLANSKTTIVRCAELCNELGLTVKGARTIVNKASANEVDGIPVQSMFDLTDFQMTWEEKFGKDQLAMEAAFVNTYKGVLYEKVSDNVVRKL